MTSFTSIANIWSNINKNWPTAYSASVYIWSKPSSSVSGLLIVVTDGNHFCVCSMDCEHVVFTPQGISMDCPVIIFPFSACNLNGADNEKEWTRSPETARYTLLTGQEIQFNAKPSSYPHHKYPTCNRSKARSVSSVRVCVRRGKGVDKKWVLASRRLSALWIIYRNMHKLLLANCP